MLFSCRYFDEWPGRPMKDGTGDRKAAGRARERSSRPTGHDSHLPQGEQHAQGRHGPAEGLLRSLRQQQRRGPRGDLDGSSRLFGSHASLRSARVETRGSDWSCFHLNFARARALCFAVVGEGPRFLPRRRNGSRISSTGAPSSVNSSLGMSPTTPERKVGRLPPETPAKIEPVHMQVKYWRPGRSRHPPPSPFREATCTPPPKSPGQINANQGVAFLI